MMVEQTAAATKVKTESEVDKNGREKRLER